MYMRAGVPLLAQLLRCSRPPTSRAITSHTEYLKILGKTALGFIVMGFIGFFVKLLFIVSVCSCAHLEVLCCSAKPLKGVCWNVSHTCACAATQEI